MQISGEQKNAEKKGYYHNRCDATRPAQEYCRWIISMTIEWIPFHHSSHLFATPFDSMDKVKATGNPFGWHSNSNIIANYDWNLNDPFLADWQIN